MTDTSGTAPEAASGEVIEPSDVAGAWLTPPAAALHLDVSERTLWRYVEAGRYHKRIVRGRAEVFIPGAQDASDSLPDSPDTPNLPAVQAPPDTGLTLAVIEELRAQRLQDADTIDRQAQRIAALEREAGTQAARANGLEAQLAAEVARRERAEQGAARLRERRWWRFW